MNKRTVVYRLHTAHHSLSFVQYMSSPSTKGPWGFSFHKPHCVCLLADNCSYEAAALFLSHRSACEWSLGFWITFIAMTVVWHVQLLTCILLIYMVEWRMEVYFLTLESPCATKQSQLLFLRCGWQSSSIKTSEWT